jgi:hypothetical protein
MKKMALLSLALAIVCGAGSSPARAQNLAAAEALLERAVAALKTDQPRALAEFTARTGVFKHAYLDIFCFDMSTRKITAHPRLIGQDVKALSRLGPEIGEQLFNAVREGTMLTVGYMDIAPPGGKEPVLRQAVVTRVGDQGCVVGGPT